MVGTKSRGLKTAISPTEEEHVRSPTYRPRPGRHRPDGASDPGGVRPRPRRGAPAGRRPQARRRREAEGRGKGGGPPRPGRPSYVRPGVGRGRQALPPHRLHRRHAPPEQDAGGRRPEGSRQPHRPSGDLRQLGLHRPACRMAPDDREIHRGERDRLDAPSTHLLHGKPHRHHAGHGRHVPGFLRGPSRRLDCPQGRGSRGRDCAQARPKVGTAVRITG